jgi:Holliday junction resolvasome RuvABC endonuclease subunit
MRLLALDLGTTTGWAVASQGNLCESGVESFIAPKGAAVGWRWIRFNDWLTLMIRRWQPTLIVWEAPILAHKSAASARVAFALSTRVEEMAARNKIKIAAAHNVTVKKFITGRGDVKKEAVTELMRRHYGARVSADEADALAVMRFALAMLAEEARHREGQQGPQGFGKPRDPASPQP